MAVVVTDRRTIIDTADTVTGWNQGTSVTTFFAEASACVAVGNNAPEQIYYTGTAQNATSTLIYVYGFNNGLQNLWTNTANPPVGLLIGDGTNTVSFNMAGDDRKVFVHSDGPTAWQNMVLDTDMISTLVTNNRSTNRSGTVGALNVASLTQFGGDYESLSKALGGGYNMATDIIRIGNDGLRITGGTTGDRGTFLQIAIEDRSTAANKAHGVLRELVTDVYGCQGPFTFGGPTETSWFAEEDIVFVFENRDIADDKYYFNVEGGSGATHFSLVNSTVKTAGPGASCNFSIGGAANIDSLIITGTGFAALKNDITFGTNVAHQVSGCSFVGCGQVYPGTVQFFNNTIQAPTNVLGGLVLGSGGTANMSDLAFISSGTGHGVYIDTPGTYTFEGWTFSGYGASETADAAVYNNSGGAVTINITGGGDSPTVRNGTGATTAVQNAVSFQLTGLVDDTEVRIYRVADDVELFGVENSIGGTVTYNYNAEGDVPVYIHIHHINYVFIRLELTLGSSNASVPIQQRFDRNYLNPE